MLMLKSIIPFSLALGLLVACGEPERQPLAPTQPPDEVKQTIPADSKETAMPEEPEDNDIPEFPAGMVYCPEVRPEICTMEYDPVLGFKANGESAEYSNKCTACSDTEVVGYIKVADDVE
jgi:hypothetical protein